MKKLHNSRGETLVEVLASILIASLSVALLFGCVMASSNMDRDAKELDKKHYEALAAAEARTGASTSAKVTVTNDAITDLTAKTKEIPVDIYGDAELYSYKRAG